MTRYERGATLIVVLMILLIMTIVGTLAIRQSISSLKLVSNNQMQSLLLQNSDAAFMTFHRLETTQTIAGANGVFGFFKNEDNWNKELIFCFKGDNPFLLSNASWLYWQGTTKQSQLMATGGGACKDSDISAGRAQVVTQVHIKRAISAVQPFSDLARGTDVLNAKMENSMRLRVQVTSVMKGLVANPSHDLFDSNTGCLNKSLEPPEGVQGLITCLRSKDILYNTQVAEYRLLSDFEPSV